MGGELLRNVFLAKRVKEGKRKNTLRIASQYFILAKRIKEERRKNTLRIASQYFIFWLRG